MKRGTISNSKKELLILARNYYVNQGLEVAVIAKKLNKSEVTIRNWLNHQAKLGDDWKKSRSVMQLTEQGQDNLAKLMLAEYIQLYNSVVEELKANKEISVLEKAEVLSKLANAYMRFTNSFLRHSPELDKLAFSLDILRDLTGEIKANIPQLMNEFIKILDNFSQKLVKKYG